MLSDLSAEVLNPSDGLLPRSELHAWASEKKEGMEGLKWRKIKTEHTVPQLKGRNPPLWVQNNAEAEFCKAGPGIGWSRYSFEPRGKGDSITSSWRCYQWIQSAYFTLFIRASFKVKGMIQPACMFCVWNLMTTLCLHNEYSSVEIHQVYGGCYNNMALYRCSRNWICNTAKWNLRSGSRRPLHVFLTWLSTLSSDKNNTNISS